MFQMHQLVIVKLQKKYVSFIALNPEYLRWWQKQKLHLIAQSLSLSHFLIIRVISVMTEFRDDRVWKFKFRNDRIRVKIYDMPILYLRETPRIAPYKSLFTLEQRSQTRGHREGPMWPANVRKNEDYKEISG